MSFKINGQEYSCDNGCTSLSEHHAHTSAEHYIEPFENNFEDYLLEILTICCFQGNACARTPVQALINSYHELGQEISPIKTPHFKILQILVTMTGASFDHSGQNESIKILEPAMHAPK